MQGTDAITIIAKEEPKKTTILEYFAARIADMMNVLSPSSEQKF